MTNFGASTRSVNASGWWFGKEHVKELRGLSRFPHITFWESATPYVRTHIRAVEGRPGRCAPSCTLVGHHVCRALLPHRRVTTTTEDRTPSPLSILVDVASLWFQKYQNSSQTERFRSILGHRPQGRVNIAPGAAVQKRGSRDWVQKLLGFSSLFPLKTKVCRRQ